MNGLLALSFGCLSISEVGFHAYVPLYFADNGYGKSVSFGREKRFWDVIVARKKKHEDEESMGIRYIVKEIMCNQLIQIVQRSCTILVSHRKAYFIQINVG